MDTTTEQTSVDTIHKRDRTKQGGTVCGEQGPFTVLWRKVTCRKCMAKRG